MVFAVQCPNPKCRKFMLVEHHDQGKVVSCLLCKAAIKVGGKMFALVPLSGEPGSVNLKCDPELACELREVYVGIRPGYHQDKRHWNTVELDGSVDDDVVHGLIEDSYDLVVAGLPRSIRVKLATD